MIRADGLAILAALSLPIGASAGDDKLDVFRWLEGSWTRDTQRGASVESWTRVSEGTMEGTMTLQVGDAVMVTESLRLERMGDDVFYVAKPRENEFPTAFRLVESDDRRFVFENPLHDFPQKIVYTRTAEHSLVVEIARIDDAESGIEFEFERVASEESEGSR